MKYTLLSKSVYEVPEEEREQRDELIMDDLLFEMKDRETIVKVEASDGVEYSYCDGTRALSDLHAIAEQFVLYDMADRLEIKDGIDLVQFENGNKGLVAYYNGRKSYLEIIKDAAEVARLRDALREEDEDDEY